MKEDSPLQLHINDEVKSDIAQLYKHADIANKEMGKIKEDIGAIKTDLDWLKKSYWVIAGASISGLIAGVLNLLW